MDRALFQLCVLYVRVSDEYEDILLTGLVVRLRQTTRACNRSKCIYPASALHIQHIIDVFDLIVSSI